MLAVLPPPVQIYPVPVRFELAVRVIVSPTQIVSLVVVRPIIGLGFTVIGIV